MSLQETNLAMAVKMADAAAQSQPAPGGSLAGRLADFTTAYAAIASLPVTDEDWAAEALDAAWALVASAYPRGAPIEALVQGLDRAHATVLAVADRPLPEPRPKPRRDA